MILRSCAHYISCCAGNSSLSFRGRVFSPYSAQGLPQPVAFFPLTEGAGSNVTSWPTPDYTGSLERTGMRCALRAAVRAWTHLLTILRYTSACVSDRCGAAR